MSIIVKYTNVLSDFITEKQANQSDSYSKYIYYDGLLKKIEYYGKARVKTYKVTTYFLDSSENKDIIIEQFTDSNANFKCVVYFNQQISGSFSLWDREEYTKEGILVFKGKDVFDSNNKMLLSVDYVLGSDSIKSAYKYYYGNRYESELKDRLLEFSYDSTGQLLQIMDVDNNFGYLKSIDIDQFLADTNFSQVQFPWVLHPYYHSLYPFLPQSDTV